MKTRFLFTLFLILPLLLVNIMKAEADKPAFKDGDTLELFSDIPHNKTAGMMPGCMMQEPEIVRCRLVEVQFDFLTNGKSSLSLNLFDGISLQATNTRFEWRMEDSYTWFGRIPGEALGTVILSVVDGDLAGHIALPGGIFEIRPLGGGVHGIYEIDQSAFSDDAPPIHEIAPDGNESPPAVLADDGSIIDVMVLYTQDVTAAVGNIDAMIQLAIDQTNTSYENSGINQRIRLVHAKEVIYTETGNLHTDLGYLTGTSDRVIDHVHGMRNNYGADLVSLWVENRGDLYGCGHMMTTVSHDFEDRAFSVVATAGATSLYIFGHETGHNMGAHHDHYAASEDGAYNYSHGYVYLPVRWRTIMAYNQECRDNGFSCTRLPHWSNPDVNIVGVPTGVPAGQTDPSDNRLTLNNTAYTVANFRVSECSTGCLIRSTCYGDGELKTGNECLICDPFRSYDSWSIRDKKEFPVASFDGDSWLVVWQDCSRGISDVIANRVDLSGNVFHPAGLPVAKDSWIQTSPTVAAGGGEWLVVWQDDRNAGVTGTDLYGQRVNDDGSWAGNHFAVSTGWGTQWHPDVAFGSGSWLSVWYGYDENVYGQRMNADGSSVGGILPIAGDGWWQVSPAVSAGDATWLVVWQDDRNAGGSTGTDLYGQRINFDGSWAGNHISVSTAWGTQWYPDIAFGSGSWLVVWQNYDENVYGQRVSANGSILGSTLPIAGDGWWQVSPAVAAGDATWLVVWQDDRDAGVTGTDLYGQRINFDGSWAGNHFAVSSAWGTQQMADVAHGDGMWLVVWTNYPGDIFGQRVTENGSLLGDDFLISIDSCPDCEIDGVCYATGQDNPENVCQYCNPSWYTNSWSSRSSSTSCNTLYCKENQYCSAGSCTGGTDRDCSDGLFCTEDSCNESNNQCVNDPAPMAGIVCRNAISLCDPEEVCDGTSTTCPTDQFLPSGTSCEDGDWCNGAEVCADEGACQTGTAPDCNDNVACTDDTCDEVGDACVNQTNDDNCDNGLWCDGAETCDLAFGCLDGSDVDCNDNVGCTNDSCNEADDFCDHTSNDIHCDNGLWCDGNETCDLLNDCQAGTAPDCNDNVTCTTDSCNETTDACENPPNDALCADALWCNGDEVCIPIRGCEPGPPRNCSSHADDCNWGECDETTDQCYSEPKGPESCDDGLFCTVDDQCAAGVCLGDPNPCDDAVGCTDDSCDEVGDACVNQTNDANCDDGDWCDGAETCDAINDCQVGVDPCDPVTEICNETDDICEVAGPVYLTITARLHGSWNGTAHTCESLVQIDLYDESLDLVDSFFDITFSVAGTAQVDMVAEGVPPGSYYVVLRHLNHIDLMTAAPVSWDGATAITVDLTNPANVECGTSTMYEWSPGVWTMPAGDIDPDSRVALSDFNYLRSHWTETDSACDLDCDGFCRLGDFNKLRQTWNTQGCAP